MNKKVLVIDDEFDFVDAIKMRLEANGYEVISAHNGNDGIEKAAKEAPALIFLDLVMPKLNGFEALSRLKTDPRLSHIPVIIITAKSDTEYAFDAGKLGADDYIIKPVSMEGVLGLVKKYIG
ncbi:MAG: response regulator [Candidatus Omnitrophica bacterium]|nr:response regulator [Candidatus Omnitrophota bacterium]MCM8790773.1 response regulator [Candidatus Omnitrophota bacterium]